MSLSNFVNAQDVLFLNRRYSESPVSRSNDWDDTNFYKLFNKTMGKKVSTKINK